MPRLVRTGFALLLVLLAARAAATASVSILFVGNSLTQVNNLPEVFKRFAAESPLHAEVEVKSSTPGGAMFYDHWKSGEALRLLREQRPNFLILQGQSTEPLSSPQNFAYYAARFKSEADRVHTKTILFSTWARPASDAYYKDPISGGSPTEMQTRLNLAYGKLARKTGAVLAPIGITWERAQRDASEIQLLDGTQHPSPAGTYLAAAVLFRTVFDTTATSNYFDKLPKETALHLQHIANEISLPTE